MLKSELSTEAQRLVNISIIGDLARGYRQLAELAKKDLSWKAVASELGLGDDEATTFSDDWPDPPPKSLPDLVAAVLKGLLAERPGTLLPYEDGAARLSISVESLLGVLDGSPSLSYRGPFCLMKPRVWRMRLDRAMNEMANGESGPDAEKFSMSMQAATRQLCRVCGEHPTQRACALCRRGVDQIHYVTASELIRPAWSEPRIICFSCIEDGLAEDERFPKASHPLVQRLRDGEGWDA